MKNIVLLCSAGMSTSMMVAKMKEAAKEKNCEVNINAYSLTEASEVVNEADIILLGPQVRFQMNQVKGLATCPVEVIDMRDYGTMNGKNVFEHAMSVIGE